MKQITMNNLITILLILLSTPLVSQTNSVIDYYNEITTKNEKGDVINNKKYNKDIYIYVDGEKNDTLLLELNKIVDELNVLISPITIYISDDPNYKNILLYFGSMEGLMDYTGDYHRKEMLENNWGIFWYLSTNENEIYHSWVFVDTQRTSTMKQRKHLLREELTQSLGMPNDSYKYPNSIFYGNWTETTEYSSLDKEIIKLHYNN
tara:strand:- start:55 stop:672 length:618 start_codon:yes stop_codon:yes gene_type:complete